MAADPRPRDDRPAADDPRRHHLELVRPPRVVVLRTAGGAARALLLARRGRRAFVQVHRGTGDEVLAWVAGDDVHGA